jgi:Ca2+-binding RTX toxin-like protein
MGRDRVSGGLAEDFLVGGLGRDKLNGREGDDSLLGGAGSDVFVFSEGSGDDQILDFVSGEDRIDLRAFDVGFDDVEVAASGANTLISVGDFEITLANADAPVATDFLFA